MIRCMKMLVSLAILCSVLVLSVGCWNNRPLKTIGITAAVGFDKGEGEKIEFTVQIVKPSAMAIESPKKEKAVWVIIMPPIVKTRKYFCKLSSFPCMSI